MHNYKIYIRSKTLELRACVNLCKYEKEKLTLGLLMSTQYEKLKYIFLKSKVFCFNSQWIVPLSSSEMDLKHSVKKRHTVLYTTYQIPQNRFI